MTNSKYNQKEFYLLIKKNLRRIHYEKNYSRAKVAESVDISFQAYSDMLTLSLIDRYPSLETLRRLCIFFKLKLMNFLNQFMIQFFKKINIFSDYYYTPLSFFNKYN